MVLNAYGQLSTMKILSSQSPTFGSTTAPLVPNDIGTSRLRDWNFFIYSYSHIRRPPGLVLLRVRVRAVVCVANKLNQPGSLLRHIF
jgi:hypothetical protein